jgi:DNA mismatch endonuclease (patch repair protein)
VKLPTSAATSARMRMVKRRDTPGELDLRSHLTMSRLRYRVDVEPWPGFRRRVDIAFPKLKIAIFVDGCFWHRCPSHYVPPILNAEWWANKIDSNVRKDTEVGRALSARGWTCLRYWAHADMEEAARQIVHVVRCGSALSRVVA